MDTLIVTDLKTYKIIAQALSIDTRMKIFELLQTEELNINEIADRLSIPIPTATVNVQKLEEADLIKSKQKPGIRGSQKICSAKYNKVILALDNLKSTEKEDETLEIHMPIGQFVKCKVHPTCGMISEKKIIGEYDDVQTFYHPEKINAQLIWLTKGYLEYHFPNNIPSDADIQSLEFSAELCSEVAFYKKHSSSDITVWINDIEVGTYTSPGDFGGKRGKLTPKWWGIHKTQYGLLTNWKITRECSYIGEAKAANTTINDLKLKDKPYISIRIGIKDDVQKTTGFNVFGRKCGNYEQDLLLKVTYKS